MGRGRRTEPEEERRRATRRRDDAEHALHRIEAKFASVFRACPDLIAITAKSTGRFLEVNDAFERIMGFTPEEAVGRTSLELGTWESPEERQRMLRTLGSGHRLENFETRFRRKNGEAFTALMSLDNMDLEGEDCLIIVARDISDRKNEEMQLRQAAEELQRSNLELERFAYVAAHDLQEPCRTICSFAQLLERRHGDALGVEGREFLEYLTKGALRMRDLITSLLGFSRATMGTVRPEMVNLKLLVAGVVSDLGGAIAASSGNVEMGALPVIQGDPSQLRQMFLNLIGNGLKFQPEGQPPHVRVSANQAEDGVWHFQVADNGIGIPPEHQEQIFQIFQRLHGPEHYPGTGIGLSVVKRVVEGHGGTIRVESIPGQGSTFHFTLGL